MPEPQQMLDGGALALLVVGADIGQRTADQTAHGDHGWNMRRPLLGQRPGIGAARRAHDDAGDIVLLHRLQHLRLPRRVVAGIGQDRGEAALEQRILDARRQLGKEGIVEIAHDHADQVGRGGAQAGGAAMIDIAERLHRLIDADARRFGHELTAGEHQGHGGFRYAGTPRDVDDGHATNAIRSLSSWRLRHFLHPFLERSNFFILSRKSLNTSHMREI